jgi:hypothetical protein
MTMNMLADIKAETKERNRRLARMGLPPDRIGGRPGDLNKGGTPRISEDELRAQVLLFVGEGRETRTDICNACGNHRRLRDMIDVMTAEGILVETMVERTRWYTVCAG